MNILDKKWKKKNELIIIRNTIADIVLYIKEEELLNWLKYNILYHCYSQFKYQTKLLYSCSITGIWNWIYERKL